MANTPFKMKGWSPFTKPKGEKSRTTSTKKKDAGKTGYKHSTEGFKSEKGVKAYEGTQSGISGDMSKGDLVAYVRANNKGKSASDASRISVNAAIKIWRSMQEKSQEVEPTTTTEAEGLTTRASEEEVLTTESTPTTTTKTTKHRRGTWSGGFPGEGIWLPETPEDTLKGKISGGSGRTTK